MDNTLEANGLVKRYPTFMLDSVSFSLSERCVTGLTGANGTGRTTTIRSIPNLAHKGSGTTKVFGLDADKYKRGVKDRLSTTTDGSYFYDGLSMENTKNIVTPTYSKRSDAEHRIYMEKFDLDPKQKISTPSGGTKMRLVLVLALSHQAGLLIMDESTNGFDLLVRGQFLKIIMDYMKNGGKEIFFSTHITSDLDKVADILILIDSRRIVFQQNKDELLNTFRIVKGSVVLLDDRNKRLIKNLEISTYELSASTGRIADVKREMPGALLGKANIEDIILMYVGGKSDGR